MAARWCRVSAVAGAFAAALPAVAAAACPVAADLGTGIRVSDAEGGHETFVAGDGPIVVSTYESAPGEGAESLLAQGVYLIQTMDIAGGARQPGTRTTYTYPLAPGAMPLPEPGGDWIADVVTLDQGALGTETHEMRFGDETTLTIGDCSYRMVPVEVRYGVNDGETLWYLPELGLALIGAFGIGPDREVYSYGAIEAVR